MAEVVEAFVALGSNLGDRPAHLRHALEALARVDRSQLVAVSRIYETAPVGPEGQGPYLNGVVQLRTELGARELLTELLAIEARRGRLREEDSPRWGPRVLDLDLILYGDLALRESGLEVPHPRLCERAFVLVPLCDLIAERTHPTRGDSFAMLRAAVEATGAGADVTEWAACDTLGDLTEFVTAE